MLGVDLRNDDSGISGSGTNPGSYPVIFKYRRRGHGEIVKDISGRAGCKIAKNELSSLDCTYFVATTRNVNIVSQPNGMVFVTVADN